MPTIPLEFSTTLDEACHRFLTDIESWVQVCLNRYDEQPPTDVHDQGTYTTGWEPYLCIKQDEVALSFLRSLRDRIQAHFTEMDAWRHGYWRMQEAHHGTEHFELFLGTLLRLEPDDAVTCAQLVDAAEHMGNWVAAVDPWFDWETGLFRSIYFGSDGVRQEPGMDLNMPDHLRCATICLLAFRGSGEARFLELAATYGRQWAAAILADEALPIGLTSAGPLYTLQGDERAVYQSFAGMAPDLDTMVDRAENILCSDGVRLFLSLWQQTGVSHFRQAAERLLDVLTTQLSDPDAGAAADAVRHYRQFTGSDRYDPAILAAAADLTSGAIQSLGMELPPPAAGRESGIGKRGDMPRWLEDGQPRRHNPILLAVAAEISRDETLATQAIDLARAYFGLARLTLPDGRDHGCSARSVSAVARGHGRDNHAGMTTAVLGPIWDSFLG